MSEQLIIQGDTKQERYEALLPQIKAVVEEEADLIANMANLAAMLHETSAFGGQASIALKARSWCLVPSKVRWLALASERVGECVELLG